MCGKLRLLLPVVLAVLLAVSSAQNVFAATEIAYDDGTKSHVPSMPYLAVRFTPSGQVRVVGAKFWYDGVIPGQPVSGSTTGYVTGADHTTVLLTFPVTLSSPGWYTIPFSNGPIVFEDFYIAIAAYPELIGSDALSNSGRSYSSSTTLAALIPIPSEVGDLMIRALVESTSVGGIIAPTNKFLTLAPYLTLIGLIATAAVAVKKRRN